MGRLGVVLDLSWAVFEASWVVLGRLGVVLEEPFAPPDQSLGRLGTLGLPLVRDVPENPECSET